MDTNKPVFCTIVTGDHIHYALSLRHSLIKYNTNVQLYVLITDIEPKQVQLLTRFDNVFLIFLKEVCNSGIGKSIYEKYFQSDMDALRWSLKPVFIAHVLRHKDVHKIIYVDCDIYFFNDYTFLFEQLNESNVLLSPHWRSSDPHKDPANFAILYTNGLYNGGFIAANKFGIPAMDWWAMACEYVCVKDTTRGLFVDQVHLNLLPVYFENIGIVRHRGCNVASWNRIECYRTASGDNRDVVIAGEYPIVFIHFTRSMFDGIISGEDILLKSYLEEYYSVNTQYAYIFKLPLMDVAPSNQVTTLQTKPVNDTYLFKKKISAFLKTLLPVK